MKWLRVLPFLFLAVLAGCTVVIVPNEPLDRQGYTYSQVEDIAIQSMRSVQSRSFTEKREFCGWVWELNGELQSSRIVRGGFDRCQLPEVPSGAEVYASYHTHGNHTPEYASEFPSIIDIQGDFDALLYGFVGTPGGRVWLVDPFDREVLQVCGEGCLPIDPTYRASDYEFIPYRITRDMLFG